MAWLKKLGVDVDQKVGGNLVVLLLLAMFVTFAWQAVRPILFNVDLYDFNSHYLASYAVQHGLDPYNLDTLQGLAKDLGAGKVTIFRYPPFWLVLLTPFGALPHSGAVLAWQVLNLALLVAAVWLIAKTLRLGLDARNALVIGLLLFNYDPLIYNLAIGNTNLVILVLLVSVALAWTYKRETTAGVLLGLASAVKVTPVVFLAYFLWKRNFRLVASAVVTILASIALGWLVLGERMSRAFLDTLTTFATEDNAWIGNQSWRGFLDRIFVGDEFVHAPLQDPNLDHWLYYGGVALFAALTALILFRSRRTNQFHLEFALGLFAYLIVSPTTWVHHLVWAIYPLVALALACLDRKKVAPTFWFGIGYLLIALTLEYRNEAIFQWPASLWISSKFYGLLILYAVNAWLLLTRVPSADQAVSSPA